MENEPKVQEGLEPKTSYTKEEVDALLQSEADKRVTQALKKEKEESKRKIAEAEKLAKMDEEQRYKYELDNTKAELDNLRLEKAKSENTTQTLKVLANRNLPAELLDYVLTEDADSTFEKVQAIEKIIKKLVDAEVSKRIPKQGTPKSGTELAGKLTKEQFSKFGLAQQSRLLEENPNLLKELK